jgi:hypothetical protein
VAGLTGMLALSSRPKGMRVIVRRERPYSGAQLRFHRPRRAPLTCFVTGARRGQLADLGLHPLLGPLR